MQIYYKSKQNKAFTLAESLVTLIIIGIVAAMTIPGVIASYEKTLTADRLKSAYAILSQAITRSEADNGSWDTWNYDLDSEPFATTYITPYLNIIKICGTGTSATDRCFAGPNGGWYALDGTLLESGSGYDSPTYYKVILNNGMSIGINTSLPMDHAYFVVDINGPGKGWSKFGYDTFFFSLRVCSQWPTNNPYNNPPTKGNRYGLAPGGAFFWNRSVFYEASRAFNLSGSDGSGCNPGYPSANTCGSGASCAAVIAKDGWRIADDYPWAAASSRP